MCNTGTVRFTVAGRSVQAPVRGGIVIARVLVKKAGVQTVVAQYSGAVTTAPSVARSSVSIRKATSKVKLDAKKFRKAVKKAVRRGAKHVMVTATVSVAGKAKVAKGKARIQGKGIKARTAVVKKGKMVVKVKLTKFTKKVTKKRVTVRGVYRGTATVAKSTSKKVTVRIR